MVENMLWEWRMRRERERERKKKKKSNTHFLPPSFKFNKIMGKEKKSRNCWWWWWWCFFFSSFPLPLFLPQKKRNDVKNKKM